MPVAIPCTLIGTLANDTSHLDFTCQRIVGTCKNTLAIHHRTLKFDIIDIEGFTFTLRRLFKRPDSQHVITIIRNLFVVRTGSKLINHNLPSVTTIVPCYTLSIIGTILTLKLYQHIVRISHLQTHGQTAQCLEVYIANRQCCVVVLVVPATRVSLQRELHYLVAIFFYYSRICTVPETSVRTDYLVRSIPQNYLCVTNCRCEEHCE